MLEFSLLQVHIHQASFKTVQMLALYAMQSMDKMGVPIYASKHG